MKQTYLRGNECFQKIAITCIQLNYVTCVALLFSLSLWIVDLLWKYNAITIFELSLSFTEKRLVLEFYVLWQGGNTEAYLESSRNLRSGFLQK